MARTKRDGLYRRENGIFAFRYKSSGGVWREKYTGTAERESAREFKRRFLDELDRGALPNELSKWPIPSSVQYYLQVREGIVAPRTLAAHRHRSNNLVRVLRHRRLDEIDNRALDAYQSTRRKEGVSAATINKEMEILTYILRKAKLWKRVEEDYQPLPVSHKSPRQALTVQELHGLVETGLRNPDWEAALLAAILAANTACRSWEIKSLRLADVDLRSPAPKLVIRRENTKSDAGAREIELNGLAVWTLQRLIDRAAALGANQPAHFLFPADLSRHTRAGDPLNGGRGYDPTRHQHSWRTAWRSMTHTAGLPHIHFHDLRHTAITRAREQGVEIGILKALVGHMDGRMVEYYSHIGTDVKRRAVERIGETYRPLTQLLGLPDGGSPNVN